jgi:hypothetical protein
VAELLVWSIEEAAKKYGQDRLAFLTGTTGADLSRQEFERRYNSLNTNVLTKRYVGVIKAVQRQPNTGHLHFHDLVVMNEGEAVGGGIDWDIAKAAYDAHKAGDYSTEYKLWMASLRDNPQGRQLGSEWDYWWHDAPKRYGFGRCEMLPLRTSPQQAARYMAGYMLKGLAGRIPEDKGKRLVDYSKSLRIGTSRFVFNSPGGAIRRKKLERLAIGQGVFGIADMKARFGAKWSYKLREAIASQPLPVDLGECGVVDAAGYDAKTALFLIGKFPSVADWRLGVRNPEVTP